ncbi:MAG: glutamine amidotransferase-related protein, partial [Endozoicomonas sp.]
IVKSLTRRGARVVQVPAKSSVKEILSHHPDGILLSNGPGDPAKLLFAQETIQKLLEEYEKPMFGICLGHQLLALVAGAETFALPFGHRGGNVPVKDLFTERAIVTSQNHGYAVKTSSIPAPWQPWFECLNDATNEGLRHPEKWVRSVQFHPEASPGPEDVQYLFDDFISAL